jgi:hypothetical protein
MIATDSHRVLRVLLLIVAIFAGLGGLLLIASSSYFAAMAPAILQVPPSMFYLVAIKFIGIFALALSYLAFVTSRDPVRYAPLIDALAFLLIAAVALDLYASFVLHLAPVFTGWFVIVRSIIRLGIAVALIALRPRQ